MKNALKDLLLEDRILILDGAMGTMLQKHGLSGQGQQYNLTHPEIVASIHRAYIEAGADIIETNTFSGGYETSLAGARIAREEADKAGRPVLVAGSMGPTTKSLSICMDMDHPEARATDFDEMSDNYREQIRGLQDGGADMLLLETCFDALNVKAAIYAWDSLGRKIPVMVSGTFSDGSGRLLTGQSLEGFYTSVKHCDLAAFGLNCGLGATRMIPLIQEISRFAECPVICYPNAGLPNEFGQYTQSPEEMAAQVKEIALTGHVNIVGGCCGSTPDHIRAIAEAVRGIIPTKHETGSGIHLSGLEHLAPEFAEGGICGVGRDADSNINAEFAKQISEGDLDSAMMTASMQVYNGVQIVAINMDAVPERRKAMKDFVRFLMLDPGVSKAPFMIESSDFDTLTEGLKNAQGRCIASYTAAFADESDAIGKALKMRALGAAISIGKQNEQMRSAILEAGLNPCDLI